MEYDTGSRPDQGGSGGGTGFAGPPGPAASGGGEFDYRDPVQSFLRTVRDVLTRPALFFSGVRRHGDLLNPLLFALICSLILNVLSGFLVMLAAVATRTSDINEAVASFIGEIAASIIFTPIVTTIVLFVSACIYHLMVVTFVGHSRASFEATFRVVCYASAVFAISWIAYIFSPIPLIGWIIALLLIFLFVVYILVIQVLGFREVHATTTGRAVAVVLGPFLVIFVPILLLFGSVLLVLFGAALQA